MTEDRFSQTLGRLAARGESAFVPFVVLGDPTPSASLEILLELVAAGADGLELGLPFSDPIADGPTIQAADSRALAAGTTTSDCWSLIAAIREAHPALPMGLLCYANLLAGPGLEAFYKAAHNAGVDAVLVADVPVAEGTPFIAAALEASICPVFIAPPGASEARLADIAKAGRGYTYVVARSGVTGADTAVAPDRTLLDVLAGLGAPPALVGFGISRPEHVRQVCRAGAAGAISGSAVVALVERHVDDLPALLRAINGFVREMKAATITSDPTGD